MAEKPFSTIFPLFFVVFLHTYVIFLSQQAISVIYLLSDSPDELAGKICHKLSQKMAEEPKNALLLRRTFFVIGHIAVCHLNYLDCSVFGELKRRNALREQKVRLI